MAYFTAVLAATPSTPTAPAPPDWQVVDVDLDDVADVDALADALSDASDSVEEGALVIAVLEREDEWFALARPGGDGVRLFVSDLEAAGASRFAEVFDDVPTPEGARAARSADDVDDTEVADATGEVGDATGDDGDPSGGDGREQGSADDADARTAVIAGPSWAGDAALLADVGLGAEELVETSEGNDPATALAALGERVGFVELLEALR